ncbi:MAG: hypothetical protein E7319_02200 [Clostridiales bacterium]|nr:hypothetical protein [Clostridiales bacterium]
MTAPEILMEIGRVKPHQYTDDTLMRWLSELDGRVWEDVMSNYLPKDQKPALPYSATDALTQLLIPFPHDDVYIKWLTAQIDYHNADFDRYNNSMLMWQDAYQGFVDSFTRSHVAKAVHISGIRGIIA